MRTIRTSFYEHQERRAARNRALGYSLLWLFMGAFVFGLSTFTGRSYPLDATASLVLVSIGLVKLVRYVRSPVRGYDER